MRYRKRLLGGMKNMVKKKRGTTSITARKKKKTITQLKKQLWELVKQTIRKRDGPRCVICGATGLDGSNWQTGHFIPSSTCGAFLRYDLRNLHSNCYRCNINLGGNGAMYYEALKRDYGQGFIDSVFGDKQTIIKADTQFYEQKIQDFQEISSWDKDKLLDYTRALGRREGDMYM